MSTRLCWYTSSARRAGIVACCLITAGSSLLAPAQSQDQDQDNDSRFAEMFFHGYCIECHSAPDPAGERNFEAFDLSKSDLDTQVLLQDAIDQVTLGTMPPPDGQELESEHRLVAIEALSGRLQEMRQQTLSTSGKTVLRRLSRREYRRTIGDLLGIRMTMFDPTIEFPSDNLGGYFDNLGSALVTSGHLLEKHLDAADQSVEKALAIDSPQEAKTWEFKDHFYQQPEVAPGHKAAFQNRYICLYDHPFNEKPEGAYGHISEFPSGVSVDGVYEIRVLAKAMHRDTPYGPKAVRLDLDEPFRLGVRPGDTSIDDMVHTQPIQPLLAESIVPDDEFRWITFRVYLDQGFAPRFTFENGSHDFRGSIGRIFRLHKDLLPSKIQDQKGIYKQRIALIEHGRLPHIRIDEVQIQGPVDAPWPTLSRKLLYEDSEFDHRRSSQLIEQFASRAFRRPPTAAEMDRLCSFYETRTNSGSPAEAAFRDTLKAILCSPSFLYFQQPDEAETSDFVLAERLAFFLTSTGPDQRLRELAADGQLSHPDTLRAETRRLLSSPASNAFVSDFLDSWLGLRTLGSMPPDPGKFWFYYAADLEQDMQIETRQFFRDLIDRDAPLSNFLAADYSFINRDLAKLYGEKPKVPPKHANDFRRVTFDDPRRGGLLGQASILTVSANGIETSPVVRGVWLLENILGTPPPPPPDEVPAIDPDTRGARSIRDQLTKHRADPACFECHRKIDPLGFALESFDAIGQSRQFYDQRRKQPIDTSGELPGGAAFQDVSGLKDELYARRDFFARTVAERLLMHALGRRIEPTDRKEIDQILKPLADKNYPTAELIESIVLSHIFQR